jgi:hypothetical protein
MLIMLKTICLAAFCALGSSQAFSYSIQILGQALALGDTAIDSYGEIIYDGATSVSYDTGLLTGTGAIPGTARSFASVDLATGSLKAYAEANDRQVVNAYALLSDEVYFDLPDGMTETSVSFFLRIEGNLEGNYTYGNASIQSLSLSGGPSGSASDSIRLGDLSGGLPYTLQVTKSVWEGEAFTLNASIGGGTNLWSGGGPYGLMDIGNTAFLSMEMEDGVSFTSGSGVLLTSVVPIPAAAWLFGSALLGLGVVKRKKA